MPPLPFSRVTWYPALVRHYKGAYYFAYRATHHPENLPTSVVYQSVDTHQWFVQPITRFEGTVRENVPRFWWIARLEDEEKKRRPM